MYKIALVSLGAGIFLAALAPAHAVERRHYPRYEGRSVYVTPAPIHEGRSAAAPATPMPYGRRGGCLLANNPIEAAKGIRHFYPAC
jgi:hypothetical protein